MAGNRHSLRCEALEDRSLPSVTLQFDYSLDANHFFDTQTKRDLLAQAGQILTSRLGDSLTAIAPSGNNSWTPYIINPATGQDTNLAANLVVPANTIIIYAGGRNLSGGGELGVGATGGYNASGSQAWFDTIDGRGQPGALLSSPTDFAPSVGSVSFDTTSNSWYFGSSAAGLDSNHDDFLSVAMHELGHVFGIGTAPSWQRLVAGTAPSYVFTGAAASAEHGSIVPLDPGGDHWADGTQSGGVNACMDPVLWRGTRRLFTPLDWAGLADIGWQVSAPQATVQFSTSGETMLETAGTFRIAVTLSAPTGTTTTIPFTLGGNALPGIDYTGVTSSPLTIPAGQTTATITGTLLNDGAADGPETLTFNLGTSSGAVLGGTTANTLTIRDVVPGFSYDPVARIVSVSGGNLYFTQATTQTGGGTHTTYCITMDGANTASFDDTALSQVVVNGNGMAIVVTNDTYVGTDGAAHETAESVQSGRGGGSVIRYDATGTAVFAMQMSGFATSYAYVGRADAAQISGVVGTLQNTFVTAGNYSYIFGGGEFHLISGAASVYSIAINAADQVWHYDAAGGLDSYVASGHAYSYMSGTDTNGQSFFNEGVGYRVSYGISTHANAIAYLLDSPGNDVFYGTSSYSYLSGPGSFNVAQAFALVYGQSFVGGTDYAYNYDSRHIMLAGFVRLA